MPYRDPGAQIVSITVSMKMLWTLTTITGQRANKCTCQIKTNSDLGEERLHLKMWLNKGKRANLEEEGEGDYCHRERALTLRPVRPGKQELSSLRISKPRRARCREVRWARGYDWLTDQSVQPLEGSLRRGCFEFQKFKGRPKFMGLREGEKPESSLVNFN